MFIRRNRRIVQGEVCDYFTLVKTIPTAKGPRQQVVAHLGKEPGLDRPVAELLHRLGLPLPNAPRRCKQ